MKAAVRRSGYTKLGLFHSEQEGFFSFSEEMIFALQEKHSDDMAFSADLYRQAAPPIITCTDVIQSGFE